MSAVPVPINQVLEAALSYGRAGFQVFPCLPGAKEPATTHGCLDASGDEVEIRAMFSDPRFNIGLATGLQPNQLNLLAIDVDTHKGGLESWRALMRVHGRDGLEGTASHRTPHDGWHVFVNMPSEFRNTREALGKGIDTRASGGYVVVPPSRFVDGNGEIRLYRENGTLGLLQGAAVFDAVPWVVEALSPPPPAALKARSSSAGSMDSPFDWLRKHWDWAVELDRDGWQVHSYRGSEVNYTRPGKAVRDGKSAVFHPENDGSLVVFSTEAPPELERIGTPTADGTGFTVNVPRYFTAMRHHGDESAAARWIRQNLMPGADPGQRAAPRVDSAEAGRTSAVAPTVPLHPEPGWYQQRGWMAACQQMAQATGGSPAAHLLAFLTRWTTLIPPGYSIPPINGAPSSFDLLSVVAGTSGSGKTSAMRNAQSMIPIEDRPDLRLGLGLGSGEGIIESFYGMREVVDEESNKRTKVRDRAIAGVNFSISEGLIFADLDDRGGTTHVTRLCDAWSGAALSTANAKQDTFRHIDVNQYRLTMMMGIQADMADKLITDASASQGFVGRLLFVWAEEPRVRPRPKAPGLAALPIPPTQAYPETKERWKLFQPTYLDYDEAIWTECQDLADGRVGHDVPVEDHHHDLLRCKVAGILALMEGRMAVTMDDWAIATDLVGFSASVRSHLKTLCTKRQSDLGHRAAEYRGELKFIEDSAKERRLIAALADRLVKRTPNEGWTLRQAERTLTSNDTRHRFDPALQLAISNGFLAVEGERIKGL